MDFTPFRTVAAVTISWASCVRKALGDSPYFHGDTIGPLDLSLFGTLKSFVHMRSPPASAVLNQCGLRAWYERCDAAIALTFEQSRTRRTVCLCTW